jgi:hypothetical protein
MVITRVRAGSRTAAAADAALACRDPALKCTACGTPPRSAACYYPYLHPSYPPNPVHGERPARRALARAPREKPGRLPAFPTYLATVLPDSPSPRAGRGQGVGFSVGAAVLVGNSKRVRACPECNRRRGLWGGRQAYATHCTTMPAGMERRRRPCNASHISLTISLGRRCIARRCPPGWSAGGGRAMHRLYYSYTSNSSR